MNRAELEKKRQYWSEIVSDWNKSGESQASFCRDRNLRSWQLSYWHRRLRPKTSDVSSGFVRVDEVSGCSGIRLRTAGGLEIELDRHFDELTLKRLFSVLTSAC